MAESGDAADRERYVAERAMFLANAFAESLARQRGAIDALRGDRGGQVPVTAMVFHDLIDRGVLK